MATKKFGTEPKNSNEITNVLHEIAGINFPCTVNMIGGNITTIEYDTEIKVGGTTPIETVNDGGETVIEYEENYEIVKLTKTQQDNIDAYIQANLKE